MLIFYRRWGVTQCYSTYRTPMCTNTALCTPSLASQPPAQPASRQRCQPAQPPAQPAEGAAARHPASRSRCRQPASHNNTYFFSNTQYFNHTASFMEATIFGNKPETHSKDSMLFCKISCRISHLVLSEWPVLKDFVK